MATTNTSTIEYNPGDFVYCLYIINHYVAEIRNKAHTEYGLMYYVAYHVTTKCGQRMPKRYDLDYDPSYVIMWIDAKNIKGYATKEQLGVIKPLYPWLNKI